MFFLVWVICGMFFIFLCFLVQFTFVKGALSLCHQEIKDSIYYIQQALFYCKNPKFRIYNFKQATLMDEVRVGTEYSTGVPSRRKKIEITSTNKVQTFKRQNYQDSNPYSLNRNPSTPFIQRTATTPDTLSNRDTLTETSSKKSAKIIRTNGLVKAEKPNLTNSRAGYSRPVVHRVLNGSRVGPAFSTGTNEQTNANYVVNPYQQYGMMSSNYPPVITQQIRVDQSQMAKIHQQNKKLRQQNYRLRDQMQKMEKYHNDQVNSMKDKINRLYKVMGDLQSKIESQDKQWEKMVKQWSKGK